VTTFLHKQRIHADGDNKNNLYFNDLPERFGRKKDNTL
jgi:hypothetical protein